MSGQGKYTTYAPPASSKNDLLNKLFKSDDAVQAPPTQDLVGKENDARQLFVTIGKAALQPTVQQGDPGHFPAGVSMDYSGGNATIQPPNTAEGGDVTWQNPGDPANSYIPDITSPGPGKTDGLDKDQNPDIAIADLDPNYVPTPNVKSPTETNAKIIAANILGVAGKMGDSGANS